MNRLKLPAFLLVIVLLLFSSGCSAQNKPLGETGNPRVPTAPVPNRPLPTIPGEAARLADRLAAEIEKVDGVKKATVILSGSTVIVGVDIGGNGTGALRERIARTVKNEEISAKYVLVSTDSDLNKKITRVNRGIARGKPASAFSAQIGVITRQLAGQR